MSISFSYQIQLNKSGDHKEIILPNLKSNSLILQNVEIVETNSKLFELKLSNQGKDQIFSYGEAVFYQTTSFDLTYHKHQIMSASDLVLKVQNLIQTRGDKLNLHLKLTYIKTEGELIFNRVYERLDTESLETILSDIKSSGKHLFKIVFTSPTPLACLELIPKFKSDPVWLESIRQVATKENKVIFDLEEDSSLVENLSYYSLSCPENVNKLGVLIYGFTQ